MSFPLLYLTTCLGSGILVSSWISLPLRISIPGAILALASAWVFFLLKKNKSAFSFLLAATVFLGAALYLDRETRFEKNSLHNFRSESYVDFYGRLLRSPAREPDRNILFMKVEKIRSGNKEVSAGGNLRITVLHSPETSRRLKLLTGDSLKVSAQLLAPRDFQNFNRPFLQRYLKSQRIHNRAFTKSPLLVEKIRDGPGFSPLRQVSIIRQALQQKLETFFPPSSPGINPLSPEGAVLEALLLGETGRMEEDLNLSLQKTGLYHLFAISGAQIAIISFLLFSLLRLCQISKRLSYLLLMMLLVLYAVLVEGNPSVLRATIMSLAFLLGKLIWRDVHLINTISLSAFILLLVNPFSLFDLGFELTFVATLSIILFFPIILKYLPRLPLKLSEMTALSIAAQLGVLPFMAVSFNRVPFSALILNYAAVPLVGAIMAAGYSFFPFAFATPLLARVLAQGMRLCIRLFIWITHLLDGVPYVSYRIPTPHLLTVVGYFLFFLSLLLPVKIRNQRVVLLGLFACFFILLISYPVPSTSKDLRLTFIDVGQGDSILIEFPGSKKMLIDGGGLPEGTFDIGERVVSPFLWRKGIKTIDYLVLTHAHPDHLNGLISIARNFKVREFWESGRSPEDPVYAALKSSLSTSVFIRKVFKDFSSQIAGVQLAVLHPINSIMNSGTVDNNQSLVLRLAYGQSSFLLPADIGVEAEEEIARNMDDLKTSVLKIAHHGSRSSSSERFLSRVSPQMAVISVGGGNRYGLPHPDVLARLKQHGVRVFRTDLDGAVELRSDGRRTDVRLASGENRVD